MIDVAPLSQAFSSRGGDRFFPVGTRGTVFMMVEQQTGKFIALGTIFKPDSTVDVVFAVSGADADERRRFLTQMEQEGATVNVVMKEVPEQVSGLVASQIPDPPPDLVSEGTAFQMSDEGATVEQAVEFIGSQIPDPPPDLIGVAAGAPA